MAKRSPYPDIEQEKEEEGTENSTDESNDEEFVDMPHLADGDVVGGFDVDTGDTGTVKGLPLNPNAVPPQAAPPVAPPPPPMPPPMAQAAPPAAAKPMPGMPPGVTPDDLQGYLQNQRNQINKYSPDQQYGKEQAMLQARTGIAGGLSHAGATMADAIMQGVARAGSGGFAKAQDERYNDVANQVTGAEERARKGSMESVEANQKIDMQDPGSTMSKVYQNAFGPIFAKMGYDPKAVGSMPASQINTVADLGVRYADAQTQLELKKAMLQVQTLSAMANIQNQRAERSFNEKKLDVEHPIVGALQKAFGGGSSASPDSVNVVSPDGTSGTIPKANLQKALSRGYKLQ